MPVSAYQSLLSKYSSKAALLRQRLGWLSVIRLTLFIGFIVFGYKAIQAGETYFTCLSVISIVFFLVMIRVYDRLDVQLTFYNALVKLNRDEINFLNGQPSVYDNGKEYTDPHHPYSYDLDIFGEGGLFPYLNRCCTAFGKSALSQSLLHPDITNIRERQEAVKELAEKLDFRQYIQARGMTQETKEKELHQLKTWIASPQFFRSDLFYYALFIFPVASTSILVYYFISESDTVLNLFYGLFALNIAVSFSFARKIRSHLSVSTSVTKILQQFSEQLRQIETQSFQSSLLKNIQEKLRTGNQAASRSIAELASLFNYLETIINLVVSIFLNGLFLFHVHILFALEKWKEKYGGYIMEWLQLLGETEALNSFANFSFNNRSFCYPSVSESETMIADEMGHPLIAGSKRIDNSISSSGKKFVILTGSNMSGKSTFLRTIGINLVLARTGGPVCAKQFIFYPYDVHVSMRISDSLQDSESFFYAELKRLQQIVHELQRGKKIVVIFDEILRGTNSNDKHNGTVGLIRKLAAIKAMGIIATHDLTISELAGEFPDYISNKCFESEIRNNELLFDYKLREGVCITLSASFLMKKMEII
jgi:MutS domain V/MutS domain III